MSQDPTEAGKPTTPFSVQEELKVLFTFGGPIVLAQFGFLFFSVVDTYMVGQLPKGAVGGVGTANSIYWFLVMATSGTFYSLDALASQARGRGDEETQLDLLFQGLGLAAIFSIVFLIALYPLSLHFEILGASPEVLVFAKPYFATVFWSGPLFFFFVVMQRYWQAMGKTKEILAIVVIANLVNVVANHAFIFGNYGFEAMGVRGAAFATLTARSTLVVLAFAWTIYRLHTMGHGVFVFARMKPIGRIYRQFLSIGIPVTIGMALEYGVFSLSTQMASRMGPVIADTHQIGIVIISILFMLPVGLASTAAFRVGFFMGKEQPQRARQVGNLYASAAAVTMALASVGLLVFSDKIYGAFTSSLKVQTLGARVLVWITFLLVFDATQATVGGCLRGVGETKIPARAAAVGFYLVGLPIGAGLLFYTDYGLEGLWMGLGAGILVVAALVTWSWVNLPLSSSQSLSKET